MVLADYECRCNWAGKSADQPDICPVHKSNVLKVHFLSKADEKHLKKGWEHKTA